MQKRTETKPRYQQHSAHDICKTICLISVFLEGYSRKNIYLQMKTICLHFVGLIFEKTDGCDFRKVDRWHLGCRKSSQLRNFGFSPAPPQDL